MREHCALWLARGARRVEDHRGVLFADLGRCGQRRMIDQFGKTRGAAVVDGNPMQEHRAYRGIRHALGQGRFMDQQFRAAIGQHIGDLGLLLAGRQQHGHQPGMAAANIVSTNSMRLPAARRYDRRASIRVAETLPRSVPIVRRLRASSCAVTADQRFAVRISRHRLGNHGPDARRATHKCGTTRSPKRVSSRIAGIGCCDQSIAASSVLLHVIDVLRPRKGAGAHVARHSPGSPPRSSGRSRHIVARISASAPTGPACPPAPAPARRRRRWRRCRWSGMAMLCGDLARQRLGDRLDHHREGAGLRDRLGIVLDRPSQLRLARGPARGTSRAR